MTSERPFRFGVVLISEGCSRSEWVNKCRRAEDLGYDVILAPDHLNLTSPFPSVVLAAEATQRPRVGTYVLNASFHNSALLARDIATLDQFVEGRLEVGLGTGYVEWEHTRAGVPFGSPGSRVDRLAETVTRLDQLLTDPDHAKPAQSPRPPLMVGGHGDRVLRLAARQAEIVSFVGAQFQARHGRMVVATAEQMAERVAFVRQAAGQRADQLEFNLLSKATIITAHPASAVDQLRRFGPELDDQQLLDIPVVGVGTVRQIAEKLHRTREVYGISYTTVNEQWMDAFGQVINVL